MLHFEVKKKKKKYLGQNALQEHTCETTISFVHRGNIARALCDLCISVLRL